MNIEYEVDKVRMLDIKQKLEDFCRRENITLKFLEFRLHDYTPKGMLRCCASTYTMIWQDLDYNI